jgi:ankyrin repeat protein
LIEIKIVIIANKYESLIDIIIEAMIADSLKPNHLKIKCPTAMIGLFLLLCISEIQAQRLTEAEKLNYLLRLKDLRGSLMVVRNVDYVDYTDTYDRSLLMYAAANGYTRVCRILIRKGADPNLQAIDGITAAMYASYNGYVKIVKLLLERGFNLDLQAIDGMTALMMACQNGHTKIVKLLLDNGANINLQATDGYTSLMLASQNGYTEIVKLLLDKGAMVNLQDKNNKTSSLMQASLTGFTDIAKLSI